MKRIALLGGLVLAGGLHAAPNLPFETAADRVPATRTEGNCFIRAGRILTVTKGTIENGQIIVRNGKIVQIGTGLVPPAGYKVIDATDQVVMPGIVDAHVHRGADTTNEGSESISGEVRIGDVLNPDSLTWWQALASGETTGLVLHGSANAIGGQSQVVKFKYKHLPKQAMFPGAPRMIKFALGENVTRMNSGGAATGPGRFPATRMGQEAVYRRAFTDAKTYMAGWDAWNKSDRKAAPPRRDVRLETLADILRRRIWVNCHSYRADEILMMARLSHEFGFKIATMQHALEAYKVAPELAKLGVPVSMFQDHWSFKLEGYDAIPSGPAICHQAGVLTSINTDGTSGTTALIFDGAKLMREGLSEVEALKTLTINPAKQLGVDARVGSIEIGKDADLAFYDGHPFNVTSKPMMTMVDGEVLFQRRDAYKVGASPDRSLDLAKSGTMEVMPLPAPSKKYLLTGGKVFPVNIAPIENGEVLIENGRITYVGPKIRRQLPSDVVVINVTGKNVYPGLIDAGGAFGLSEISGIRQMQDLTELGDFQPDLRAATAVQNASAHFGPAACNGLMTLVTRPAGGIISGQAGLLRSWAWTSHGQSLIPNLAMQINMPAIGRPNFGDEESACACMGLRLQDVLDGITQEEFDRRHEDHDHHDHGPMAQEEPVRRPEQTGNAAQFQGRMKQLDDYFELAKTYQKNVGKVPVDLRMEAMLPVLNRSMPVLFRTRNIPSIRAAIAFAEKHKIRGILVGAQEAWRISDEVKKSGMPVIITPAGLVVLGANTVAQPFDPYDTPYVAPHLLQKAGIKYAFQSDDNALSMTLPNRVGMHTAYGLSHAQALRAITLSAAEILGVSSELGSLEKSKRGTLIVTEGDALSATSRVQLALIDGRPIELKSKHTQLRDQYLERLEASETFFE